MASPPFGYTPTAMSPPYPAHSQLPALSVNTLNTGKRRSSDGSSGPALKRRKASTMSVHSATSANKHPLRQTSFPPDELSAGADARSPSVDSMSIVSGNRGSAVGAGSAAQPKKKRGRKSKADKAREQTPSVAGGRASTAISATSGSKGPRGGNAAAADDDDEDADRQEVQVAATAQERTEEQKAEEHRLRGMLINAFSSEQFDRYENWRAAGLNKSSVKRLVNATVSQSVPESVVLGMRSVAKVFIGDIIESARRVQAEWIAKTAEKQTDLPTPATSPGASPAAGVLEGLLDIETQAPQNDHSSKAGPLRPDHLREALRRYRDGLEGGGVGTQGGWHQQQQSGVERFGLRTRGRRLFR